MGRKSHVPSGGLWLKVGLTAFIVVIAVLIGYFLGA
jgi:hypothetical protein